MIDKIIRGVIGVVGLLFGYGIVAALNALEIVSLSHKGWLGLAVLLGISIFLELYFLIGPPKVMKGGRRLIRFVETELQKVPAYDIALGSVGLIIGLIIAYLLSQPFITLKYHIWGLLYLLFSM